MFTRIEAKKRKSDKLGKPDLNLYSIYNMPFRGIAKLMGSLINLEMVDAMLYMINGHFWSGIIRMVGARRRKGKREKESNRKLASAETER